MKIITCDDAIIYLALLLKYHVINSQLSVLKLISCQALQIIVCCNHTVIKPKVMPNFSSLQYQSQQKLRCYVLDESRRISSVLILFCISFSRIAHNTTSEYRILVFPIVMFYCAFLWNEKKSNFCSLNFVHYNFY